MPIQYLSFHKMLSAISINDSHFKWLIIVLIVVRSRFRVEVTGINPLQTNNIILRKILSFPWLIATVTELLQNILELPSF